MISMIVFSAIMGWCGTPYLKWWVTPWRTPPPEWPGWLKDIAAGPRPEPWRRIGLGIVGGILGGFAINYSAIGGEQFAAIGLGAFAGGRVAFEISATFLNNNK